jgi:hypothetical protein
MIRRVPTEGHVCNLGVGIKTKTSDIRALMFYGDLIAGAMEIPGQSQIATLSVIITTFA